MKTLLDELCIKLWVLPRPKEQVRMRQLSADDVDSFVTGLHLAEHLLAPYDEEHWRRFDMSSPSLRADASKCDLRVIEELFEDLSALRER